MIRKTNKESIAPYLIDASNYPRGNAEEVLIPETVDELIDFLKKDSRFITVAGAGTGLTASRIPSEGVVISLENFNEIEPVINNEIWVGPAATLLQLQEYLKHTTWFYPPNPTEWNASIGGTLATNASGSRSYKFGVTRDFVNAIDCVLVDGRRVLIERGQKISKPLLMNDGSEITFPEIIYKSPKCKNTAGYFVKPDMDWLDLFIGSEGTLAIFVRVGLRLIKKPDEFLSGVLFFEEEKHCWELTRKIKSNSLVLPCSLEYFDRYSLVMLKRKYPNIPMHAKAALFFEEDVIDKKNYNLMLENWIKFLTDKNILLDDSWFAHDEKDVLAFHEFRHQIPILVNEKNAKDNREKIGTDMAVSDNYFDEMMRYYEKTLSDTGLPYVIFGHIGDNHLHINLLPGPSQKNLALAIYDEIAKKIFSWNGTVSAEHGIGKKKKEYLFQMVGKSNMEDLKKIKNTLDPQNRLGAGNIF